MITSVFYLLVIILVAATLLVAFTKNLMHAVFALMLVFLSLAGVFVLAQAEFIATAQIMIYVGGVLVLLIFGVMFTYRKSNVNIQPLVRLRKPFASIFTALSVGFLLSFAIVKSNISTHSLPEKAAQATSTQLLGIGMMTDYLLIFELVALLLLIALIGASVIASNK